MSQTRAVQTCNRCRDAKRKCDRSRPSCAQCESAGMVCTYKDHNTDSHYSSYLNSENVHSSTCTTTPPVSTASPPIVHHAAKRRDRAVLSCNRCHRLKVKCDKNEPCGRCVRSGCEQACTYTHKTRSARQPDPLAPLILIREDPEIVVATWFLRSRGSSHWKALLNGIGFLSSLDAPPFTMAMREHIAGDCSSDFALPGNFPFGSVESTRYASLDNVHSLLQASRAELPSLACRYFEVYHPSLPILDATIFHSDITAFWNAPEAVDASWLAQYLVVLGLGSYATTGEEAISAEFFYASEACLAKTPYMFRPTTTNISTLCLMILAKLAAYATCGALDTSWNVMGVIVRLSMMAVLHQEWMPDFDEPAIVNERAIRRRLWTMVVYLDIQLSLTTGQQSLLPQDTLVAPAEFRNPGVLEEFWDSLLLQLYPVVFHYLIRINSYTYEITYEDVLECDQKIRSLMRQVMNLEGNRILRLTFDLFFRRLLLALHRRYAMDPDAPSLYPTSYWSSLECSLALIVHHRNLSESNQGNQLPYFNLIGRPYMLDFFAAALTTCIHLLRSDAPLAASATLEGAVPPRQTILNTLTSCIELFAKEKSKSLCFRCGCQLLSSVFELLPKDSSTP